MGTLKVSERRITDCLWPCRSYCILTDFRIVPYFTPEHHMLKKLIRDEHDFFCRCKQRFRRTVAGRRISEFFTKRVFSKALYDTLCFEEHVYRSYLILFCEKNHKALLRFLKTLCLGVNAHGRVRLNSGRQRFLFSAAGSPMTRTRLQIFMESCQPTMDWLLLPPLFSFFLRA